MAGGGRILFNKVFFLFNFMNPTEKCNLVTEQWSERFMAGY